MIPYADGLVPMRQEKQEVAGTLEVCKTNVLQRVRDGLGKI